MRFSDLSPDNSLTGIESENYWQQGWAHCHAKEQARFNAALYLCNLIFERGA